MQASNSNRLIPSLICTESCRRLSPEPTLHLDNFIDAGRFHATSLIGGHWFVVNEREGDHDRQVTGVSCCSDVTSCLRRLRLQDEVNGRVLWVWPAPTDITTRRILSRASQVQRLRAGETSDDRLRCSRDRRCYRPHLSVRTSPSIFVSADASLRRYFWRHQTPCYESQTLR